MKFIPTVLSILSFTCLSHAARSFDLPTEQKVDSIVSIFENSTPELQYRYIESLNDGRGYTAGRAGFTTATGDLLGVVRRYQSKSPTTVSWSEFASLLPTLQKLARTHSEDINALKRLPFLWVDAVNDPKFLQAQDEISNELYRAPARAHCQALNLTTPLSFLIIYDSIIQHGDDNAADDADGLPAMLARTPPSSDEKTFIAAFLKVRRADLMNPSNKDTTDEWRDSVGRVDALQNLIDQGKWDLASPLRIYVWGDTYAL